MYKPYLALFNNSTDCASASNLISVTDVGEYFITPSNCENIPEYELFTDANEICANEPQCVVTTTPVAVNSALTANSKNYILSASDKLSLPSETLTDNTLSNDPIFDHNSATVTPSETSISSLHSATIEGDVYYSESGSGSFIRAATPIDFSQATQLSGKEMIGSTATPSANTFFYVNRDADDFIRDVNQCMTAVRFVQGDYTAYSGLSYLNYKSASDNWTTSGSNDCDALKNNSNFSTRYVQSVRVIIDANYNAIGRKNASGVWQAYTNGVWSSGTSVGSSKFGCLSNGNSFFTNSDNDSYLLDTSSCAFDFSTTLTLDPLLTLTDADSNNFYVTQAEVNAETCFNEASSSYKVTVDSNSDYVLNRFENTVCAETDASDVFSELLDTDCPQTATHFVDSNGEVITAEQDGVQCDPVCMPVGSCTTAECAYKEGEMAGKLSCFDLATGVTGAMVYITQQQAQEVVDAARSTSNAAVNDNTVVMSAVVASIALFSLIQSRF